MTPGGMYKGYDLLIRSEVAVPGAIILPDEGHRAPASDIDIRLGTADLHGWTKSEGPYRYRPGLLKFEMPEVAHYLCREGRYMTVEPNPKAPADYVADMLVATALPALLWMRGEPILHACAFVPPGSEAAVMVCGASGAGKSTILRAMIAKGARVVADDTLRPRLSADGLSISGLPTRYCWGDAAGPARHSHRVEPYQVLRSATLSTVLILEAQRDIARSLFEKLVGVEALRALLLQRHRPRVPRLLGAEGDFLARFAKLAEYEIYRWVRPEGALALSAEENAFLEDCGRLTSPGNRH